MTSRDHQVLRDAPGFSHGEVSRCLRSRQSIWCSPQGWDTPGFSHGEEVTDPSTGLAMYRTGQLDTGPGGNWTVRQQDLESLKQSHPQWRYQDFLFTNSWRLFMRTDQPPFNDVRVRRALSQAIDRQALIEAVWGRGEPTGAVPRGLTEWSLPVDQLGVGAKYYHYDPQEARRLLAEAGFPKGFSTPLHATGGFGPDGLDAVQLVQHYL